MPHTDEDIPWEAGYLRDGHAFAERCAHYRDSNPYGQPALEAIMVYVATELWDRGFSRSEIKSAFEKGVELLASYAAGENRRGERG